MKSQKNEFSKKKKKKLNHKKKKKWNLKKKKKISTKIKCQETEISKKMKSQKQNEISKKMKSQTKWNQKTSEHNQCECQIMLESR